MLADHRDGLFAGVERCIPHWKTACLLSIRYPFPVANKSSLTAATCISPEPAVKLCRQRGRVGWMLADHRDRLFSSCFLWLILDSSVGLSEGIKSADDTVPKTLGSNPAFSRHTLSPLDYVCLPGSNPAFSRGRQLVSFRFEYRLPVPEHRN